LQKASGTTAIKKVVTPVETGVQEIYYCLGTLDSGFRWNDGNGHFQTFCEAIKVDSKTDCEKIKRKRSP
jgi:hypothetical protein